MNSLAFKFVEFPDAKFANEDGLLAMGGDLNASTLISAYAQGIFPWFSEGQPIIWWTPDPRMVLYPNEFRLHRSLRKTIKNSDYEVSCNRDFSTVIAACALRGNSDRSNTWITGEMESAYTELHTLGYAHSIEIKQDGRLVGGLYGLVLGDVFFGESMFSIARDASKIALYALCRLAEQVNINIIDCQLSSEHLSSLGAREIPREEFLAYLNGADMMLNRKKLPQDLTALCQIDGITKP